MELVVPVVSLRAGGDVDLAATRGYAEMFATWDATATALICGSTGQGDKLTPAARARIAQTWASVLPRDRVAVCAWSPREAEDFLALGHRVILAVTWRAFPELAAAIERTNRQALLYSHPRFGPPVGAVEAAQLRDRQLLPGGFKLAKCGLETLAAIRDVCGEKPTLWHGSARAIAESLEAGADGVVAACLASLPPLPRRSVAGLQHIVNVALEELAGMPDHERRVNWLERQVASRLTA